jgi:predicted nucleic acid-binding protein
MSNRLLVDTNILVYAIDADSRFNKHAIELIQNPDYELYTTSKNLSEFLVVLTRTETIKIDTIKALDILKELISYLKVLYPSEESYQKFVDLLEKYKPSGLRIHDFEIISIALVSGITQIATQNIDDFKSIEEISINQLYL